MKVHFGFPVILFTFLIQILATQTVMGETSILEGRGSIDRVAVSPNGEIVATGSKGGILLRRATDGAALREFDRQDRGYRTGQYRVTSLAFSNNSQFLAVASFLKPSHHEVKIWNIDSGERIQTIKTKADQVQFSSDDSMLITLENRRRAQKWDISTGQLIEEQRPSDIRHDWRFWESIQITRDANRLLISTRRGRLQGAHLVDFSTGEIVRSFSIDGEIIKNAVLNYDESYVITISNPHIRVWNTKTGEVTRTPPIAGEHHIDLVPSPRSNHVIVSPLGSGNGHAFILDIESGRTVFNLDNTNQGQSTTDCARYSKSGSFILSTDYGKTRIYDAANGELLRTLPAHGISTKCNAVLGSEDSVVFTFADWSQNLHRTPIGLSRQSY